MRLIPLLLILALHAEDKLPSDAQAAIDKANKSIATIQAKADGEITKVRLALITTLTDCQKSTTKKGDLDGALAIKAKIEALDKLTPDLLGETRLPSIDKSKIPTEHTAAQWKDIPGTIYQVKGNAKTTITLPKDKVYAVFCNPSDAWGGGGSKGTQKCSYKGYNGEGTGWMSMKVSSDGVLCPLTSVAGGTLLLWAEDEKPDDNIGVVSVKIVEVK